MSRTGMCIALLTIGHLTACSSTFNQISPTPSNGQPTGKVGPFLNSPFFLAITSGVLIGGITQLYGWAKASSDRRLAEDKIRLEKQNALLSSVADEIPVYVSRMGSTEKLKTWLKEHPSLTDTNELGRSRADVLELYTEFYKKTLETKTSTSILIEVGSYFEDKRVCDFVRDEDSAIKKIEESKGEVERDSALKSEEAILNQLLSAMADEIRQPRRKSSDPQKRTAWCLRPTDVTSAK